MLNLDQMVGAVARQDAVVSNCGDTATHTSASVLGECQVYRFATRLVHGETLVGARLVPGTMLEAPRFGTILPLLLSKQAHHFRDVFVAAARHVDDKSLIARHCARGHDRAVNRV